MNILPVKTRIFTQGEDLVDFIHERVSDIKDGTIIVVASKIVALAENRVVEAADIDKESLIREESEWQRQVLPKWWLTVRDGTVVVNAGIDESNVDPNRGEGATEDKVILLPVDCFASAFSLRERLIDAYGIKNLGIVITDSRITPLRAGVVGVALGYAGFRGVRDYRSSPDLFGRPMEVTQTNIADSLATAATLLMGEGAECQPLAIIEDAPVEWVTEVNRSELKMPREEDLFKHFFE